MKFCIYLFALLPFCSCQKNKAVTGNNAETHTNLSYGPENRQTMDLYLPAGRSATSTPLLILIHGGGWTEGDKADFTGLIPELQQRLPQFAIANLNYRLAAGDKFRFPSQEQDILAAVQFLIENAGIYQYLPRMAILGASAGGHLSLLQAYKHPMSGAIKGVISLFGPTDLVHLYQNPPNPLIPLLLQGVTGTTPQAGIAVYQQSSPLNYVTAASVPTLLFHGGQDPIVPAAQSQLLSTALQAVGVRQEYVFYPNEAHGWVGAALDDTLEQLVLFLKSLSF